MIIGIDASRANRIQRSGTEWYSFYLIKHLAALDKVNQYRLYTNTAPSVELLATVAANPNFSFRFLKWPFYSFWTLGRLTLEMVFHKPDVLFIPAHTMPLVYPRRTINTIHDLAFIREQNLYRSDKAKTRIIGSTRLIDVLVRLLTGGKYQADSVDYLYWSTHFALRRARKIITVSNFTKQEILSLYPKTKADKIKVVHNGFNRALYKPLSDQAHIQRVLEKYGLSAPYFLYVGRLEKKKNTPALIEAFALLRENHPEIKEKLVLIGNASFGYDEVKYMIEEFNLNEDIYMPGWVAEVDMPAIFNGASAFVFPTKHEGFGIPVIQALACGLPTSVSDIPVLREIAAEAGGYFDQNNKQAIAAALQAVVTDQAWRRQLSAAGLRRAQDFSWEKCAQETLREIQET